MGTDLDEPVEAMLDILDGISIYCVCPEKECVATASQPGRCPDTLVIKKKKKKVGLAAVKGPSTISASARFESPGFMPLGLSPNFRSTCSALTGLRSKGVVTGLQAQTSRKKDNFCIVLDGT